MVKDQNYRSMSTSLHISIENVSKSHWFRYTEHRSKHPRPRLYQTHIRLVTDAIVDWCLFVHTAEGFEPTAIGVNEIFISRSVQRRISALYTYGPRLLCHSTELPPMQGLIWLGAFGSDHPVSGFRRTCVLVLQRLKRWGLIEGVFNIDL